MRPPEDTQPVEETQPATSSPVFSNLMNRLSETTEEAGIDTRESSESLPSSPKTNVTRPSQSISHQPARSKKLLHRFEDFAVPGLVLFLLGNALAYALPDLAFAQWQVGAPLMLILAGISIYGINKPDCKTVIRINFWALLLIAGSMHYQYRHFTPGPNDISQAAPNDSVQIMGIAQNQPANDRLVVKVAQLNQQLSAGTIQVYLPRHGVDQTIEAGTRLLVEGELALPFQSSVPGTFNQQEYLRSQHISAILKRPTRLIAFEASNEPRYALQRFTDRQKHKVAQVFSSSLPSPQAEILGGLVLGERAIPVDKETKQAFIQIGLIHLLAASGMNVGIIGGAVLWLLTLLKVPYRSRLLVALLAVGFYCLLTGLPPSIQRAGTMLGIALLLKMVNRELSPVFLLCLTAALLVLANPDNVASIGFQFSVLTTFGLLTMVPPLQEALGYYITRWAAGLILVPLIAQLWIWPLSVAYFNQFPVHTVPLNIAALVLITPLTILGFTAGLISLLIPPLAGVLCWFAQPFLNGLLLLVQWGNSQSWAQWTLPSPAAWQIAGMYLGLGVLLGLCHALKKWTPQRKALLALLPIALLLSGMCLEPQRNNSTVNLDIIPLSYRETAFLARLPEHNTTILIAPERPRYYEARTLADYLKHHNITRLNTVLLLPDSGSKAKGSLTTGLKRVTSDLVLSESGRPIPKLSAKQYRALPAQGAQLDIGSNVHLQGNSQQLVLNQANYCLLRITPRYEANVSDCGVQAVINHRQEVRLFSPAKLRDGQFYRFIAQEGHIQVY